MKNKKEQQMTIAKLPFPMVIQCCYFWSDGKCGRAHQEGNFAPFSLRKGILHSMSQVKSGFKLCINLGGKWGQNSQPKNIRKNTLLRHKTYLNITV